MNEELPPVEDDLRPEYDLSQLRRVPGGCRRPHQPLPFPDDYDLGVNPVTGDKMGSKYSGLCMHPGCYQVVPHDKKHACGRDHGGGKCGCGKYFCDTHLILNEVCITCWNSYWQSLMNTIERLSKTKCEFTI